MILSGLYGPLFWHRKIGEFISFDMQLFSLSDLKVVPFGDVPISEVIVIGMLLMMILTQLPVSLYNTALACKKRRISFYAALLNTIPFLIILACLPIWLTAKSSRALQNHGYKVFALVGIALGRMAVC